MHVAPEATHVCQPGSVTLSVGPSNAKLPARACNTTWYYLALLVTESKNKPSTLLETHVVPCEFPKTTVLHDFLQV